MTYQLQKIKRNVFEIEIVEIKKNIGFIEVFARVWREGKQIGFGKKGTVDIERFRIFNPPSLAADENGEILKEVIISETGEKKQRRFTENSIEAILQVLEHNLSIMKNISVGSTSIIPNTIGNTTTTYFSGTNDGYWYPGEKVAWSDAHDATTATYTGGDTDINVRSRKTGDPFFQIMRGFVTFSVSIGTDTISSAVLSLYGFSSTDTINDANSYYRIVSASLATPGAPVAGDFDTLGTTALANDIDATSLSASGYNDFTLLSPDTLINKSGVNDFGIREGHDIANSAVVDNNTQTAASFYATEQTGTSQDPKLVLEHFSPVTTTGATALLMGI